MPAMILGVICEATFLCTNWTIVQFIYLIVTEAATLEIVWIEYQRVVGIFLLLEVFSYSFAKDLNTICCSHGRAVIICRKRAAACRKIRTQKGVVQNFPTISGSQG